MASGSGVGLSAAAMFAGVGTGGLMGTLGALLFHVSPAQPGFVMYAGLTVVGVIFGAVVAWRLARPVPGRGIAITATVLAGLDSLMLGAGSLPADGEFGLPALIGLLVFELVMAALASLWARKAGGSDIATPGSVAT
jgi:hypothetical protein